MSVFLLIALGSLCSVGLVNMLCKFQEKAENKALSTEHQRIVAEARAKAWREDKQRFMH